MHGEVAQAHAEQQLGVQRVARHLAANRHRQAEARAAGDGAGDELEHRGVERVVEVRDGLVRAVDRQRVLDEVVGADGQEGQPADEHAERERGSGNLDHAADADALVEFDLLGAQLGLGLLDQGEALVDLLRVGEHGDHDLQAAVRRGAQQRAQLGLEHLGLGQRVAHRAQAERGVGLLARLRAVERLVGADVEGADGDRLAGQGLDHRAVGFVLLFLVGQRVAADEEELGAVEPDAVGVGGLDRGQVLGPLDVGEQVDLLAVERGGAGVAQAVELGALDLELAAAQAVFLDDLLVGGDDDHAAGAVDDDELVVLEQVAHMVQADNRGDLEAARDDRGVAGGPADVGDEAGDVVVAEADGVGGREVVGDDDAAQPVAPARRQVAGVAEQHLDQALDDLDHVGLAFAQVGVLDLAELLDEVLHLLHQRPLGVAAALGDEVAGGVDQHRVGEHHQLQVDEGADLAVRLTGGGDRLEADQFALDGGERLVEAGELLIEVARRDVVVVDLEQRVRDEVDVADRDALRDRQAVQREWHLIPLRRSGRRPAPGWPAAPRRRPRPGCRS